MIEPPSVPRAITDAMCGSRSTGWPVASTPSTAVSAASRRSRRARTCGTSVARSAARSSNAVAMPTAPGHVLGAGAPVALLRPAVLLGQDVGAAPDPQRPGALRALGLVGRQRDEVRAERVDVEVEPRRRLDGVDMEQEPAPRPDDRRDLGDRLDRADLVVREHDRDEDRAVGDRALDVLGVDAPVAVDRDLDDLEAELLEVLERVADGVVLDGRRHDAVSARPAGPRGALEREVVGLGAAAREHDLARVRADRAGEPLVGVVERLPGDAAERVRRRRVAERAAEERAASPRAPRGAGAWSPHGRDRPALRAIVVSGRFRPDRVTSAFACRG